MKESKTQAKIEKAKLIKRMMDFTLQLHNFYREFQGERQGPDRTGCKSVQADSTPPAVVFDMLKNIGSLKGKDVLVVMNSDILKMLLILKEPANCWELRVDPNDFDFKSITFMTDMDVERASVDIIKLDIENLNDRAIINKMGKKFDVVVGNPPYNDTGDSNNQIYQHFWNLAFEIGDIVSLILPYTMLTGLEKGNIDKVKVSKHIPQFVKVGVREKWFKKVGGTICYFVCDKNQTNTISHVVNAKDGQEMDMDILTSPIDLVESAEKISFAKEHFKGGNDIQISSADAGKEEEGDDMFVYGNAKEEPQKVAKPVKRFKGMVNEPFEPKVLFNIISKGAVEEIVLDLKGNCLPSKKHNMFWIPCGTAERAQELYDDLTTSERAKSYFKIWEGDRERIADYIRRVFKFSS